MGSEKFGIKIGVTSSKAGVSVTSPQKSFLEPIYLIKNPDDKKILDGKTNSLLKSIRKAEGQR